MINDNFLQRIKLLPSFSLKYSTPAKLVFYFVFCFAFCLSGTLTLLSITTGLFPYRMGLISALVIPLMLLYRIKVKRVILAYMALAFIVILSGFYNQSSVTEIVLFMRTLIFSFLIYFLVESYIRPENIVRVLKLCVFVGLFQLPLVLLQKASFDRLPLSIKASIEAVDIGFGTFNFKGDASMTFFLTLIVIFLLFDHQRNTIFRYKWLIAAYFTITILIANAEIVKAIVVLVWGLYLITHLKTRTIIYFGIAAILILGILLGSGLLGRIWSQFSYSFLVNARIDFSSTQAFFSGNYARGAAVAYYLEKGILWFGDGPSRYYDVFSRTRALGNTGHLFTFYSEVGLFGWLGSVLIFFLIAFPGKGWKFRLHWVSLLMFAAVQLLSFTTEIMNDISIVLIFCIMAKYYLIPTRRFMAGPNQTI